MTGQDEQERRDRWRALRLARLRARGQLAEVRAAELRFTPVRQRRCWSRWQRDSGLPDSGVTALAERTEGWAAGLQLAGLSLRGQDDIAGFVAAFTGSHRYMLDFLAGEVLERQSEQVRTFLLETWVLERLSGPLYDAGPPRSRSTAPTAPISAGTPKRRSRTPRGPWPRPARNQWMLASQVRMPRPGRVDARPSARARRPSASRSATWPGGKRPSALGLPCQDQAGTPPRCPASSIR